MNRKGIILAGGSGTRLYPITRVISKQLLPVFDKPMIYYPLTTLMLGDIRDILVITTEEDQSRFVDLLQDGSQWGINISYATQKHPNGIAEALILAENFINNNPSVLILGDNIYYGNNLYNLLTSANSRQQGATIFAYQVNDPERYGVVEFDKNQKAISLEEKPMVPKSKFAITGLYFYDEFATNYAKSIKPSARGEKEITDLNRIYLQNNNLSVEIMGRGFAWLDTGTHESLLEASQFIATLEHRQGLKIACPEEIALRKKWITVNDCEKLAQDLMKNNYGKFLLDTIEIETIV